MIEIRCRVDVRGIDGRARHGGDEVVGVGRLEIESGRGVARQVDRAQRTDQRADVRGDHLGDDLVITGNVVGVVVAGGRVRTILGRDGGHGQHETEGQAKARHRNTRRG